MSGSRFRLKPCCRRRLSIILIVLGSLLVMVGIIFFILNLGSSSESTSSQETEEISEDISSVEKEDVSSSEEVVIEDVVIEAESFMGTHTDFKSSSFMIADGSLVEDEDVPSYHTVTMITSEVGVNPKTNEASDNLLVDVSVVPDREFSVAVIVSTDNPEITGTRPDSIQGIQWVLTYSNSEFSKSARMVESNGTITSLDSDHFNIRFAGNETRPDVDFFGPVGTEYYALMIYDDTYFTLILPKYYSNSFTVRRLLLDKSF